MCIVYFEENIKDVKEQEKIDYPKCNPLFKRGNYNIK